MTTKNETQIIPLHVTPGLRKSKRDFEPRFAEFLELWGLFRQLPPHSRKALRTLIKDMVPRH